MILCKLIGRGETNMRKNKISVFAIVLIICSFILFTSISFFSLNYIINRNFQDVCRVASTSIYDSMNKEFSDEITAVRIVSNDSFLIDRLENEDSYSREEMELMLKEYLSNYRNRLSFSSLNIISDKSKSFYSDKGFVKTIDDDRTEYDIWYKRFKELNKEYNVSIDLDEQTDEYVMFVDTIIKSAKNEFLGVCAIGVPLYEIQDIVKQYEEDYGVNISIVNDMGEIQIDTDEINIKKAYIDKEEPLGVNEYEYVYVKENDGYTVIKYMPDFGWYLVVEISNENSINVISDVMFLNIVIVVVTLATLLLAVYFIVSSEKELEKEAYHDSLTGIYNRLAFDTDIFMMKAKPLKKDDSFIIIDINGLKTINDKQGHAAGDELIKGAAECILNVYGKHGKCYRTGGDEFTIVLSANKSKLEELKQLLDETTASWSEKNDIKLSVSYGAVTFEEHQGLDVERLLENADNLMYSDKDAYYERNRQLNRRE